MSAQNLLFSNLPVSTLGLYDSTTQTIQTINSDSSGNINLNSNTNVNGNLTVSGSLSCANCIQTGSFIFPAQSSYAVTFPTPFPSGSVPTITVTNVSGVDWPQIYLSTSYNSNTGFTVYQWGTDVAEQIGVQYIAVVL